KTSFCYYLRLLLLLLHKINSESFSFSFDFFEPGLPVALVGDAISYGGAILLTRRDQVGGEVVIRKNSVGRAVYFTPIHLWDRYTGNVADFTTEFTFVVDSGGPLLHGDGLVFFISPVESALHIPVNSSGGYLGLFNPENAFNPNRNRVVAVELDSFGNEWDPVQESLAAHVGIDVNSLRSVKTADWPINSVPRGSLGKARISYDSKTKELSVTIIYDGTKQGRVVSLSQIVDLKSVLPEWVRIGFSAATGDLVESHDILSWSFSSSLRQEKST
ncbi:LOW QUALITY PROTEIN: lectin 10-like, partial [Prosopis cineraria]|uniref:LOW QUALITY PROTEIN: lectin 10-like n=1 Tax=Prosopis cineraria TaxID=364024 RepID=UPI00240F892F